MTTDIANDPSRYSPVKGAAVFFAIAAFMSVLALVLSDTGSASRWYYWYATFFCFLWAFIGYRIKPRSYPVGESRTEAIRGAVPQGLVTGVCIGLLYWLAGSPVEARVLGVFLGIATGVQSYMTRRGFKPGELKSLWIPPTAGFVVAMGVTVISIVFFR